MSLQHFFPHSSVIWAEVCSLDSVWNSSCPLTRTVVPPLVVIAAIRCLWWFFNVAVEEYWPTSSENRPRRALLSRVGWATLEGFQAGAAYLRSHLSSASRVNLNMDVTKTWHLFFFVSNLFKPFMTRRLKAEFMLPSIQTILTKYCLTLTPEVMGHTLPHQRATLPQTTLAIWSIIKMLPCKCFYLPFLPSFLLLSPAFLQFLTQIMALTSVC